MTNEIDSDYRSRLLDGEANAYQQFDKAILYMAGGALGVSFAFVDKFIKSCQVIDASLLIYSWTLWGFSLLFALAGFYLAPFAFRKATRQYDKNKIPGEHVGGWYDYAVVICNLLCAALFIIGVFTMIRFVSLNYGG